MTFVDCKLFKLISYPYFHSQEVTINKLNLKTIQFAFVIHPLNGTSVKYITSLLMLMMFVFMKIK